MKTNKLILCMLLALVCCGIYKLRGQNPLPPFFAGEIYMKVDDAFGINLGLFNDDSVNLEQQLPFLLQFVNPYGITSVKRSFYFTDDPGLSRTFRIYFTKTGLADGFVAELESMDQVDYAEKVPAMYTDYTPNDLKPNSLGSAGGQWHLYEIAAQQAWDLHLGDPSVVVAVVDNAIQSNHTDLAGVMVAGYDVADLDNDPSPPNNSFSHGTHVAGIVGAKTDNATGIASIGFGISIMPIKATYNSGYSNAIYKGYEGITWATDHGAHIINCSWGGSSGGTTAQNVVNYAWNNGSIVVAAAGNNNNSNLMYPAAFNNVLAVASTDDGDTRSSFSSYGSYVDVSAPGGNIYSLVPFNGFAAYSGTSMASPLTAGLLGLMKSANGSMTNLQLINCLTSTCDNIDAQNPSYIGQLGSGRINAFKALQCLQGGVTPCPPSYVFVSTTHDWTASCLWEAQQSIEASNKITGPIDVQYDAGVYILLKDGFYAGPTNRFWAVIDGCGGLVDAEEPLPAENTGISVFPNPVDDMLTVRFTDPPNRAVEIQCLDLSGKLLFRQTLAPHTTETTLQLHDLPAGMYFLYIESDQPVVKKIVKQDR